MHMPSADSPNDLRSRSTGREPRKPGQGQRGRLTGTLVALAVGIVHVIFLAWAIWPNRNNLNPDGISYLRLATYYAELKTPLMISGYWGPMLSWIAAVWIKLGVPVLVAGRVSMALSAVVFAWGARALLRAFPLPAWAQQVGFGLAVLWSVFWSIEYISPDLLVCGLMCFGAARMLRGDWVTDRKQNVVSGVIWGLAYLAKAVALPMAFAVGTVIAWLWHWREKRNGRQVWMGLAITWIACLAVGLPWMAVLSVHYGKPTFSTSAAIAHAVVGPPDVERYHPYARTIHKPDPGRITAWEDPSTMPYKYWSPFESGEYFKHQLRVMRQNAVTVLVLLGGFDVLHTGLIGLAGCVLLAVFHKHAAARSWLLLPCMAVCLAMVYLPVYVQIVDQRYFYFCYPVIWAAVCGVLVWLAATRLELRRVIAWVLGGVAFISFIAPAVLGLMVALTGLPDAASQSASDLAVRLRGKGIVGPVVGSGMVAGGRAGLYMAFLLEQPWYGDAAEPSAVAYEKSGARLVVVNRRHSVVTELDTHSAFRCLDERLFGSEEEASLCPVKIYELRR